MKRNTTFLTDDQRLQLIDLLHVEACSCVIRNGDVTRIFRERGVKDLYRLLEEEPELLDGAFVADKVVGKGAAALMILGGVGFMFGTGGGALIAKTMGEGKAEKADKLFSMTVFASILCGLVLTAVGLLFLRPFARRGSCWKTACCTAPSI